MKLKTVEGWTEKELSGKRVLVRVDYNVPVVKGRVGDAARIVATLPTIRYLRQHRAKVILLSHLGRPAGKKIAALSLRPLATELRRLLGASAQFVPDLFGPRAKRAVAALRDGEVLLLENLRFHPGEEQNSRLFAHALASLGDLYVNDAFAAAHRVSASIVGLPRLLPAVAGLLLRAEVAALARLLGRPKQPFVAVLGGAKVDTKIGLVAALARRAHIVAIGGALCLPILAARGLAVGRTNFSSAEKRAAEKLRRLPNLLLPVDLVAARSPRGSAIVRAVGEVQPDETVYDIGPETIRLYAREIKKAQTIVWNGPLGFFEIPKFSHGTKALALAMATRARGRAYGVVGGGETVQAVAAAGLSRSFDWISTGGGAMVEFLEGKRLPGIAALE